MELTNTAKKILPIEDGMMMDVTMQDGQILFSGVVDNFNGDTMFLVSPTGGHVPPVTYGTELKLRARTNGDEVRVYHGVALGSKETMWKVGELCDWYGWERRSYYRQSLSVDGIVRRARRAHARSSQGADVRVDCKILDISGGGILFGCSQAVFERDDELQITQATLLPDEPPFAFYCVVKRVEKARFNNIYGCQFIGLDAKEEERLVRCVFRLQQLERRRRAGMN